MTRYGMVFLVTGSLFWAQAAHSQSALAVQKPAASANLGATVSDQGRQSNTSDVAPDAPVITLHGLCSDSPANKTAASNCKTVITRAQFERVIDAIQPGMPKHARREFADHYADALVMAEKAYQLGLDKGANYEEQMKLARIQVLSQALKKAVLEKASQVSANEIEDYYDNNRAKFEKDRTRSNLRAEKPARVNCLR